MPDVVQASTNQTETLLSEYGTSENFSFAAEIEINTNRITGKKALLILSETN